MKLWLIVLTGLVLLLLADVAVLQARWQSGDLEGLRDEVTSLRDELGRLSNWEAVQAEIEVSPTPTPTASPRQVVSQGGGKAVTREVYVPLGSGATNSQDWVNTGAQAYIDTNQYQIKAAYFEATLRANSGQVVARLVNKNENEYIWGSEVSHNTPTATLIRSGKINLPAGNKLYVVQLRAELPQDVFLDGARVRLLVQE